jgi:hypothetical protein
MAKREMKKSAPDATDVIEAANHKSMTHRPLPDENVLPKTGGPVLERAGIDDSGYLVKKGLVAGVDEFYNYLPPGMNIEDQHDADIRPMQMYTVTDLGYPSDGWD